MNNKNLPQPWAHEHVFLGKAHDDSARRTLWVLLLTLAMMVAEILVGYLTGSMALLADGFHMATHAGVLAIATLAYRFARRHAHDPHYSFGTGKVGDLAGFASALLLGVVAIGIAVESLMRLVAPVQIAFDQALWIAVLGLVVNLLSAWLLAGAMGGHHHDHHDHDHRDHQHHHHGHHHDNNFRSAYVHILADALISVLAIIALLAGRYLGLSWLDPLMGLVGAYVIARWAVALIRNTARMLLDTTDAPVATEIRARLDEFAGLQLTDLHVWKVGPQACAAIVSVVVPTGISVQQIRTHLTGIHDLEHLSVEVA
ncbi:cation diffusion facilitator family transporter [Herbaspirillum sp. Sphag1AN]|uniref:CDF family Co(II)/Ni(II) efflux transporter DmeF n=1 Tax=unclassified Herbaspirillum TaxID=2624150 RepID=UPI001621C780|nr:MULTISPECIES: CDF family Co(II)/Ni(II) efflux transporter DmeF [unclassified Herbaspirillum]MBB3211739.1 cation diffusion facilitator family transporter [Herbaspirillum sp. Sphag1AN]MBB3244993.1 cation diffusion facilitator family transporter [Herbaspirillum sp. Sphag64]